MLRQGTQPSSGQDFAVHPGVRCGTRPPIAPGALSGCALPIWWPAAVLGSPEQGSTSNPSYVGELTKRPGQTSVASQSTLAGSLRSPHSDEAPHDLEQAAPQSALPDRGEGTSSWAPRPHSNLRTGNRCAPALQEVFSP